MTNWKDIHEGFGKKPYSSSNETYQQIWEQANITKKETREWIEAGFEPHDYQEVKQWKNFNFSPAETKTWLEVGLSKYDWEFASWLRTNNHAPELVKNNLEQFRNDYKNFRTNNSQTWLEQVHPNHNIKELDIAGKDLKGELNLSQYQQLEELKCHCNKLTNITLPTSLKKLNLRNNNFNQDLSFLVSCNNLEELNLRNNNFTGSLDYLSGVEKLKKLNISNTYINEVNIDKLPRSLKEIEYSAKERPNCKLTAIIPLLEPVKYGWCDKCKELNTSENWCQPCAEQEWEKLTGQELVNKFIEQQGKDRKGKDKLPWIPYEKFTDIKHLADGGFSKIYKAKCKEIEKYYKYAGNEKDVVLKSLNNSQNITLEFLTEIANTKLVDGGGSYVVNCYGISQDPTTKNYLMVMDYKEDGDLRQYLQNKDNKLSLENKLYKLSNIAKGLSDIHNQNLVHQDFHSGNILGSYITDLGLSRPVNHPKQTGQIFGVLPYVAPEVLRGERYTQKADIYSFGIITYELFANSFPYPEMDNTELTLRVCQGLRPNLDKVPLPQECKDLIKSCWDSNSDERPKVEELLKIINNWTWEVEYKGNTPFYQQYQEIEAEYDTFSKNTPYQIHPTATTTSKMIDTKQITQLLETYSQSLAFDFTNFNLEDTAEQINQDWTNIHPSFTNELIQQWQEHNFTFEQGRDWINTGLQPTDYNFCAWLRDNKKYTSEQVLNKGNLEQLNQEFFAYWQEQQFQTQIEKPLK